MITQNIKNKNLVEAKKEITKKLMQKLANKIADKKVDVARNLKKGD
jgi:hypothetical protein